MIRKESSNDSYPKVSSSHLFSEGLSEKSLLEEFELPNSLEELKSIVLKLNKENPSTYTLFKGKYQVLMLNSLFKWHKPFGELLEQALVICGAKPKKISETESNRDEVFSEDAGSPLALQFDSLLQLNLREIAIITLKELTENHFLYPLSENIGRKLLSLFNSIEEESVKRLPILVVCHDGHSKPSSFFGSWKENKNARFHMFNKGSITKQEQLPKLSVLKDIHLKGFPPSFSNIEISVYARYDFIEYECEENAALKPVEDVNLFVECSWLNSRSILEPLTDECQCFARLKAISGNFDSGAFSLFKEIKLVEALHQSLENGMMAWPAPERNRNILQEIEEFIKSEKLILMKNNKPAPVPVAEMKDPDLGLILEQALIKGRTELDFTEKLWNILKDCSSTEELTDAFSIFYNELGNFFVRPFVHHKNNSTVAQLIKTMMEKAVVCPNLESQLVLKLLLEIGVEKLRRDYVAIFFSLELIPLECLSYYLQPSLLSLEAITCLRKLHSVVESTIVCVKILNLSKRLLSTFVRNSLKYYATVPDIDLQHVFNFQIPTDKARQLLNPMRPTIWELSLTSSLNGFLKQSIHRYQTTPVHDHIYAPKNISPNIMLKNASYTYLTSVFVQDDLL
ncbi:protein zwilch homolog [Argiope bruennichi]|uniref:protein zwilch homolog n=1 Tax=Argiope bruennichi TaxID=94029 RepID=UPI002494A248|nr:protein zwilch homolog [Argiope bruennichi]XP_055930289.1 protein zwilch homolog [Argiope bruennichi]XP_055930291.1 protein zwilch homolog [Argiope bruennichi]